LWGPFPEAGDVSTNGAPGWDESSSILHSPVEQSAEDFPRFGPVAAANLKMANRMRQGLHPFRGRDITTIRAHGG
jgi:hypothetical protein